MNRGLKEGRKLPERDKVSDYGESDENSDPLTDSSNGVSDSVGAAEGQKVQGGCSLILK